MNDATLIQRFIASASWWIPNANERARARAKMEANINKARASTRAPPEYKEAQRRTDKASAISKLATQPGVYFFRGRKEGGLDGPTPLLAGYVNVANTSELHLLFRHSSLEETVLLPNAQLSTVDYISAAELRERIRHDTWADVASGGVPTLGAARATKESANKYKPDDLFAALQGRRTISGTAVTEAMLDTHLPVTVTDTVGVDMARGILSNLVTMYRILKDTPTVAVDHHAGNPGARPLLVGYTGEDWSRAYWFMRAYWRDRLSPRDTKPQKKPATPPEFLTEEDVTGISRTQQASIDAANKAALEALEADAAEDLMAADRVAEAEGAALSRLDAHARRQLQTNMEGDIERHRAALPTHTWKQLKGTLRPPIDEQTQRDMINLITKDLVLLYPKALRVRANDETLGAMDTDATAVTDRALREEDLTRAQRDHAADFWALIDQVNARSARPPSLRAATSMLGIHTRHVRTTPPGAAPLPPATAPAAPNTVPDAQTEDATAAGPIESSESQTEDSPAAGPSTRSKSKTEDSPPAGPSTRSKSKTEDPAEAGPSSSSKSKAEKSSAADLQPSSAVSLYPWQIMGAAWAIQMEEGPIGAALIADDVGLGKTLTALEVIHASPALRLAKAGKSTEPPVFRPTLILAPASAIPVWIREITEHYPSITLLIYVGDKKKARPVDKARTQAPSIQALLETMDKLPQHDPATARTVVLSTYATWNIRSLYFEEDARNDAGERVTVKKPGKDLPKGDKGPKRKRPSDDEGDEEDEAVLDEADRDRLLSYGFERFDRLVCDETHRLKSVGTLSWHAADRLGVARLLLLSATPMINRPIDLEGLLALAWKPDLAGQHPVGPGLVLPLEVYEDAGAALDAVRGSTTDPKLLRKWSAILHPASFRAHMNRRNEAGQVELDVAHRVLPPILTLFQLRRNKTYEGKVGNVTVRVRDQIPPYAITTVELVQHDKLQEEYERAFQRYASVLKAGGAAGDDATGRGPAERVGRIDTTAHRLLCHLTLHPELEAFAVGKKRPGKKTWRVAEINAQREQFNDLGAALFHERFRYRRFEPQYDTRPTFTARLVGASPKLKCLLALLRDIVLVNRRKALVFVQWPMNLWLVEVVLAMANFKVISIRSQNTAAEREEAVEDFNDPSHESQALVTSYLTTATSVNLQRGCCDVIFVDIAANANTALQAIGRVFRIGQPRPQQIWILVLDHSYDQVSQARAAVKMIGQIAGGGDMSYTDEDLNAARAAVRRGEDCIAEDPFEADAIDEDASASPKKRPRRGRHEAMRDAPKNDVDLEERAKRWALHQRAAGIYQRLMGQRSTRHQEAWLSLTDLRAKDALPEERGFRQKPDSPGDQGELFDPRPCSPSRWQVPASPRRRSQSATEDLQPPAMASQAPGLVHPRRRESKTEDSRPRMLRLLLLVLPRDVLTMVQTRSTARRALRSVAC
ncbi:MAG TPA: SNF2-related protein [Acetobacteraceae bacterium]